MCSKGTGEPWQGLEPLASGDYSAENKLQLKILDAGRPVTAEEMFQGR